MKTLSLRERYDLLQNNILLEEIDVNEIKEIAKTFEKIDNVFSGVDLPSINEPIEKAREEMAKIVSGGGSLIDKVFKNIRQKKILSDIIGMQVQVLSLLKAMPSIMTLVGKDIKDIIQKAPTGKIRTTQPGQPNMDMVVSDVVGAGQPLTTKNTVKQALIQSGNSQKVETMTALISKALKPGFLKSSVLDADQVAEEILDLNVDDFAKLIQKSSGAQLRMPISKEDFQTVQQDTDASGSNKILNDLKDPNKKDALLAALKVMSQYGALKPDVDKIVASYNKKQTSDYSNQ